MVIESFDRNLYVNVHDPMYIKQEAPAHSEHSIAFEGPA